MYRLSLPYLNLRAIKNGFGILLCLLLCACSTTEEINNDDFSDNRYSHGYIGENYYHTHFTSMNENTIKKSMNSDHQLMMSILNRPITADQAMMLAFKQERSNYNHYFSDYAVKIKGDKRSDTTNARTENVYTQLISQDINAIDISAPN
jgi:hypothetical protein